jgi:hypothetical protein
MSEPLLEIGSEPDEASLTLCVYGPDLVPSEVSALTGAAPTDAWARGDLRARQQTPASQGTWLLSFRALAPRTLHDLVFELSAALRPDLDWQHLNQCFTVRLSVALHSDRWNFGPSFTPEDLQWLASTGAPLSFDIYAYAGHENEVDTLDTIGHGQPGA